MSQLPKLNTPCRYGQFELRPEGVYHVSKKQDGHDDEEKAQFICSWLEVAAQSRDQNSEDWGDLLRWRDMDDHVHQWSVPRSLVVNNGTELIEVLAKGGLKIAPSQGPRVKNYISAVNPQNRVLCVSRPGWHRVKDVDRSERRVLALTNRIVGNPDKAGNEDVVLQQASYEPSLETSSGTLEEWQNKVANLCLGNAILMLAVSLAFAAPTLELLGRDSGGFHLHGLSSSGKSTVLGVAASVWGYPVETWRTTDNALEETAERHNDVLLALDELSQLDERKAAAVAYMLGNGEGKQRMTQAITLQKKKRWRLLFLSTGEVTLSEHAEAGGKTTKAGTEMRMVNIDADAGVGMGIFQNLHGEHLPSKFADKLKNMAGEYRGTAGPKFAEYLITDEIAATERLRTLSKEFNTMSIPPNASGEIHRVADRFGLVAAAGELASEAGITSWPIGAATQAVRECFNRWISSRSTGSSDVDKAIEKIRAFLLANSEGRFEELNDDTTFLAAGRRHIYNRAGFRRTVGLGEDQTTEYLLLPETFKNELCKGCNSTKVAQELDRRGYLRKSKGRLQFQQRIDGMGKGPIWFYAIKDSIFADAAPDSEVDEEAA
jgi:putative DNA primase/helicase